MTKKKLSELTASVKTRLPGVPNSVRHRSLSPRPVVASRGDRSRSGSPDHLIDLHLTQTQSLRSCAREPRAVASEPLTRSCLLTRACVHVCRISALQSFVYLLSSTRSVAKVSSPRSCSPRTITEEIALPRYCTQRARVKHPGHQACQSRHCILARVRPCLASAPVWPCGRSGYRLGSAA